MKRLVRDLKIRNDRFKKCRGLREPREIGKVSLKKFCWSLPTK